MTSYGIAFLVLSIINGLIVIGGAVSSWRRLSVHFMFWVAAGYFIAIPLFIDATILALPWVNVGDLSKWISLSVAVASVDLQEWDLIQTASFVVACNIVYLIASHWMPGTVTPIVSAELPREQNDQRVAVAGVLALLILFLVLNEKPYFETSFDESQNPYARLVAILLATLSGGAYWAWRHKRIGETVLFLGVPVLLALATSKRVWALGAVACVMLILMCKYRVINPKTVTVLALGGVLVVGGLNAIRAYTGPGTGGALGALLDRDPSSVNLYSVFADDEYYRGATGLYATYFLVTTGWYPDSLGLRDYGAANIPGIVASRERNWGASGTVHTSIYGWLFIDAGIYSVTLIPFFVAMIVAPVVLAKKAKPGWLPYVVAITGVFIFLFARGSVQHGYSKYQVGLLGILGAWTILMSLRRM